MASLGPEARATAQSVFGRDLEDLESVDVSLPVFVTFWDVITEVVHRSHLASSPSCLQQLSDFVDMIEVLGENMGVEFDLLNQEDDNGSDDDEATADIIDALFSTQRRGVSRAAKGTSSSSGRQRQPPPPSPTGRTGRYICSFDVLTNSQSTAPAQFASRA